VLSPATAQVAAGAQQVAAPAPDAIRQREQELEAARAQQKSAAELQEKLKADGYDYEVVNAGVSGDTSQGGLERIDWAIGMDNVKILILELGANDLLRGIPVATMRSNLDQIIRKAKEKNIKVLLCGMIAPPTMGPQYQREFTMTFPQLANEHKVDFVPFVLENIALKKELNQADGIHPQGFRSRRKLSTGFPHCEEP